VASRDGDQPGSSRRRVELGVAPTSSAPPTGAIGNRPPSVGRSRSGGHAAEDRPAGEPSARALPDFVHAVPESVHTVSVPGPSFAYGELEEVAVCDLCGLVAREPAPLVCPACGGGFG
jgi:hypothetical protein